MEKRFTFKCWNCQRDYTLFKAITDEQALIVPCPYCNTEAVIKLAPYKKEKKTVMRGDDNQAVGFVYDFPDVIPTQKPEN